VEQQEKHRYNTLVHEDQESEQSSALEPVSLQCKELLLAKHKTEVLREMLQTSNLINIDEISLHSSDDSNFLSSTDKKLSEIEQQLGPHLSRSSLAISRFK